MMSRFLFSRRMVRLYVSLAPLMALGGCLSDAQLTGIWQSVLTTGLGVILTSLIGSALGTTATGG